MASRTAWTPGNAASGAWTAAFNSSDLASLANGSTVRSTIADIANGTNLDIFAHVSISLAIASNTIVAGATIALFIYGLNQDGTTYGDALLPTAGTAVGSTPVIPPIPIPLIPGTTTTLIGSTLGGPPIVLPYTSFRWALQNNSGFALTSGTQTVKFITGNMNLNN